MLRHLQQCSPGLPSRLASRHPLWLPGNPTPEACLNFWCKIYEVMKVFQQRAVAFIQSFQPGRLFSIPHTCAFDPSLTNNSSTRQKKYIEKNLSSDGSAGSAIKSKEAIKFAFGVLGTPPHRLSPFFVTPVELLSPLKF